MVKNDCRLAAATTGALEMQSIHIYIYIAIYIYLHTPMFTYIVGVSFQHGCLRKVISFPLRSLRRSADAGV